MKSLSIIKFNETFKIVPNRGDGNCLFLAVQYFFPTETHLSLRRKSPIIMRLIFKNTEVIFLFQFHMEKKLEMRVNGEKHQMYLYWVKFWM